MRRWPAPCARCPWAVVSADFSPVPPADSGAGRGAHAPSSTADQACQAARRPGRRARRWACWPAIIPTCRLPARQGRTAPLADPEPVGRAERPLPAGRGERRGVDPAPCLPPAGGQAARRAWRRWNLALCPAGAAAVVTAAACRTLNRGAVRGHDQCAESAARQRTPVGHQPLRRATPAAPWDCVLGPINVSRFVRNPFGVNGPPGFDFSELGRARCGAPVGQRAGPDPLAFAGTGGRGGQAPYRRGLSGLGDALLMLRLDYGSPAARVRRADRSLHPRPGLSGVGRAGG